MHNLIEQLGFAIIIADEASLSVEYLNSAAKGWLGDVKGQSALALFPSMDGMLLKSRIGRGKTYAHECSIKELDSVRMRAVALSVRKISSDEYPNHLLIECSDISKVREQESLLENFNSLILQQMQEIENVNKKNEELLLNILPKKVMDELRENGTTTPQTFHDVTIMFLDFVDFTQMEVSKEPARLFAELNDIYTRFDDISKEHDCERIKTIGDTYLAVCGLPNPDSGHATKIARVAQEIVKYLDARNKTGAVKWECRIGIHTGPVIGGVVGVRKYIYDVFGDSINTASRMQTLSESMKINVSAMTRQLLGNEEFCITPRGKLSVKGMGEMDMFYVET